MVVPISLGSHRSPQSPLAFFFQVLLYDFSSFAADLGGFLGLLLGVSGMGLACAAAEAVGGAAEWAMTKGGGGRGGGGGLTDGATVRS